MWFARCWQQAPRIKHELDRRDIVRWSFQDGWCHKVCIRCPRGPLRQRIGEHCVKISAYCDTNCWRRNVLKNCGQTDRQTDRETERKTEPQTRRLTMRVAKDDRSRINDISTNFERISSINLTTSYTLTKSVKHLALLTRKIFMDSYAMATAKSG